VCSHPTAPLKRTARLSGPPAKLVWLINYMVHHNNLRPQHLPKWPVAIFIMALAMVAGTLQYHFQVRAGWLPFALYLGLLFTVIVCSFRPAWGRRAFWISVAILFGLHSLGGLLLRLLFPKWLDALGPFLTLIVVADLLLTMSVIWRVSVGKWQRSY